jgi:hypothetical protein
MESIFKPEIRRKPGQEPPFFIQTIPVWTLFNYDYTNLNNSNSLEYNFFGNLTSMTLLID